MTTYSLQNVYQLRHLDYVLPSHSTNTQIQNYSITFTTKIN